MKIFAKRSNDEKTQNAIPGVFALFDATNAIISHERMLVAGYAAWSIFPALISFGISFLSLSSLFELIIPNAVLVLDIVVGTWVGACLTLVGLSRLRKEPLDEKEIEVRARRAMPMLLYLFAFSFFCVIAGTYLLVIPGIVAFVWLAFADVVALDHPSGRFMAAVKTSKDLSRGRFLRVLWRIVMGNAIFGVLYLALSIVILGAVFSLAGMNPKELLDTTILSGAELPAWIALLVTALSLPFVPYVAVYNVALYDALKKA